MLRQLANADQKYMHARPDGGASLSSCESTPRVRDHVNGTDRKSVQLYR